MFLYKWRPFVAHKHRLTLMIKQEDSKASYSTMRLRKSSSKGYCKICKVYEEQKIINLEITGASF